MTFAGRSRSHYVFSALYLSLSMLGIWLLLLLNIYGNAYVLFDMAYGLHNVEVVYVCVKCSHYITG